MAWIELEKLEAIKTNLPIVGIIVLSYVVVELFKQNNQLRDELTKSQEARTKEAIERGDKERQDKLYFVDKYIDLANIRSLNPNYNRDTGGR